jgi:predicted metal-dependent hydrolase
MSPTRVRSLKYNPAPDLTYELVRSKRRKRTLAIQVTKDGTVTLLVPYRMPKTEAHNFFLEKEGWIRKQLARMAEKAVARPERNFLPGEKFLYHGEEYPLEIKTLDHGARLVLSHGTFILEPCVCDGARKVFVDWYRNMALRELAERVRHYSSRTGLIPKHITITDARTRYGSCSAVNRVSFSWRLIMAPYPAIDYVILHELAHIKVKNHSPQFWAFLETICPGWKEQRKWLRENGHTLKL